MNAPNRPRPLDLIPPTPPTVRVQFDGAAPTIRRAVAADAGVIAGIHVGTWRTAYRGLLAEAVLDGLSVPDRAAFWSRLLAGPHDTMVAEGASGLIGFCSLLWPPDGHGEPAEIAALYVAPTHWRQGAGRALCAAALAQAADGGAKAVGLWVLAANAPALYFYEAQGFRRDGAVRTETFAGGGPVDEVRLRRGLHAESCDAHNGPEPVGSSWKAVMPSA